MPFFSYKARDGRGELVEGVLEGADSAAVATTLLGNGVTPVEIGETAAPRKDGPAESGLSAAQATRHSPSTCCCSAARCTRCSRPACRSCARWPGCRSRPAIPAFKDALQKVRESLESGRELSVSLQRQGSVVLAVLRRDGLRRRDHRPARGDLPAAVPSPGVPGGDARAGQIGAALSHLRRSS